MIDNVRKKVLDLLGKSIRFRSNGSRNQIEEFNGVIIKCYKNVFLIECESFNRSYSYSDVLIGFLEIDI